MAINTLETILAQARGLSPEELAELIKRAADLLAQSKQLDAHEAPRYANLFGSGKGVYSSVEEADCFVREEREEWDE